MGRPDTIVWQEYESPGVECTGLAFQIVPTSTPPLLCGISFSSRGFVSEQALVKQAFVCGQLLGTHTPLLVGGTMRKLFRGQLWWDWKGILMEKGHREEIAG